MDLAHDFRLRQIQKEVTPFSAKFACAWARYPIRSPKGSCHFKKGMRALALIEKAMALPDPKLRMDVFDHIGGGELLGCLLTIGRYGAAAKTLLPDLRFQLRCKGDIFDKVLFSVIAQIDVSTAAEIIREKKPADVRTAIMDAIAFAPSNKRISILTGFAKSGWPAVEKEAEAIARARSNLLSRLSKLSIPQFMPSLQDSVWRIAHEISSLKPVRTHLVDPVQRCVLKAQIKLFEAQEVRDIPDSWNRF